MPSATGSRRVEWVVAARVVLIKEGIGTFTKWIRRFRYLGSQFSRVTVPATMSLVAEISLESHFVAGLPIRISKWETQCSSTMRPGSTSESTPGVASHNRKAVGESLLTAYIFKVTSTGTGAFVGAATSIK